MPSPSRKTQKLLSGEQRAGFFRDGFLVIRQFHDVENDIRPIQRAIYDIIGLMIRRHGLSIARQAFSCDSFDSGYAELISADRSHGAEVYDIVKQIPAFLRLISSSRSEWLIRELRGTDLAGIGTASYGIRIDNPLEEKFRSHWHQEFIVQPQSLDGIVFWTPLVAVSPELGPMTICRGSHKDGLCIYSKGKSYAQKVGAYKIGIVNDAEVVARYEQVAPLTSLGDLIIMDFLTIHQSGFNVSSRSRWSVQSRFFNFREPTGTRIGWKASVTAGTDVERIFPKHFVEEA